MRIINKSFFAVSPLKLAEKLLGKVLVRCMNDGQFIRYRITEVEAYEGQTDSASHAYKGLTQRTAPMFEDGGILYVYLCYGIYDLLNIVSGKKGEPGAVLIRGAAQINNVPETAAYKSSEVSIIGPGKVSRALNISRALNREDLTISQKIWLEDDGFTVKTTDIQKLKRVGISYALKEDQDKLWRFKLIE